MFYKDGPAGVRLIAWPIQTVMASTWNSELLYEFGDAVGEEAQSQGVDSWLAPAVNLHRSPIGGRNFEYYSEDPLLSGECAVAVANGVQENHNVTVCAKHFALNEQETYRRGKTSTNIDAVDSIVQERVAREIYLKTFEMLVKKTKMMNIMTSFNKINGVFAAGNDIVMPGGPPVIKQVLKGLEEGRCTIADLQRNVCNLLKFVISSESYKSFMRKDSEKTVEEVASAEDESYRG